MKKQLKNIIVYLHKDYSEMYGKNVSKLSDYSLSILDSGLKSAVPQLYDKNDTDLLRAKEAFKELAYGGYIDILGNYRNIRLTEKGYQEASMGFFKKALLFVNKNPGLAIIISLLSLAVSIIALFKSSK